MSYDAHLAELSRTPCTLLVLTLDRCTNVFGVAPCTATGTPCYNTFGTCKDKPNYARGTQDHAFSSFDAPLPFAGARPYVEDVDYLPTEIKDKLTVNGRARVTLLDERDTDAGLDPYRDQRSGTFAGSYWKTLLARVTNWKGRPAAIYEGFVGDALDQYQLRWAGAIDNITFSRGKIRVEIVDLLADLSKIEVPPKLKIKLNAAVAIDAVDAVLTDASKLPTAGYIRINDEILEYTGIDAPQNRLTGLVRACFGTVAAAHDAGDKVEPVVVYAGDPFDVMQTLLTGSSDYATNPTPGAGIDAARIDTDAWDIWQQWPHADLAVKGVIVKPTKLDKIFFSIVNYLDLMVWQNEEQKITVRRNLPNAPGRTYTALTDEAHLVEGGGGADLNDKYRRNQIALYCGHRPLEDADKPDGYTRIEVAVDADDQGENGSNDLQEETIWCRWLDPADHQEEVFDAYLSSLLARRLFDRAVARAIVDFEVELKDEGVRTGDHVRLTTDELLLPTGEPLARAIFRIWKRDPKGSTVKYRALRLSEKKFFFIAPDDAPDYADATEAQREYGYITGDDGKMSDGSDGYHIY